MKTTFQLTVILTNVITRIELTRYQLELFNTHGHIYKQTHTNMRKEKESKTKESISFK